MSGNLLPMTITVFAAVGTYYLLSALTPLPEVISMAGGVIIGIISAVVAKRITGRGI